MAYRSGVFGLPTPSARQTFKSCRSKAFRNLFPRTFVVFSSHPSRGDRESGRTHTNGLAKVWDLDTGAVVTTLGVSQHRVNAAKFSPDGTRIVTVSDDKIIRLWDAETGAPLSALEPQEDSVSDVTFSADGRQLLSVSEGSAKIWRMDPIVFLRPEEREAYVRRDRLMGADAFTDEEMLEPLLRERLDLADPCHRTGSLNWRRYWNALASAFARASP